MAALAGANLQAMLQNRWTVVALGAVYVVLALDMFGVFTLQLPARLRDKLDGASCGQRGGTLPGAAAMRVLSALLVGPCMTAPLAGALLSITQSRNVVQAIGPPTVMMFDTAGRERRAARLVGKFTVDQFSQRQLGPRTPGMKAPT